MVTSTAYKWVVDKSPTGVGNAWGLYDHGKPCGIIVRNEKHIPGRDWKYEIWGPPNARNGGDFLGGFNNLAEAKEFLLKKGNSKVVKTHLRV